MGAAGIALSLFSPQFPRFAVFSRAALLLPLSSLLAYVGWSGCRPSPIFIGGRLVLKGYLHSRCWRRLGHLLAWGFCMLCFPVISMFVFTFVWAVPIGPRFYFDFSHYWLGLRTCSKVLIYSLGDVTFK